MADELPDKGTERLQQAFDDIDVDGTGSVTIAQLMAGLRSRSSVLHSIFGKRATAELFEAFRAMDEGEEGVVTRDAFVEKAYSAFQAARRAARTKPLPSDEAKDGELLPGATPPAEDIPMPPPMTREILYRSVFNDVDEDGKGRITAKKLVQSMRKRRGSIAKVFGLKDTAAALSAFSKLDESGSGEVTFSEFFTNAELAFTKKVPRREAVAKLEEAEKRRSEGEDDLASAPELDAATPPLAPEDVPYPPAMTRELLYRSVFSDVDKDRSGYISQKKLVKSMNRRRSSISLIFGASGTEAALTAFRALDEDGDGRVTFDEFFNRCETAFMPAGKGVGEVYDGPSAAPEAEEVPFPPPMTRELLYRSVYDEIDTARSGVITQMDLVRTMKKRRNSITKIFGAEDTSRAIKAFETLDTEGTGVVTWMQFFDKAEDAFVPAHEEKVPAPRRPSLAMASPVAIDVPAPPPLAVDAAAVLAEAEE